MAVVRCFGAWYFAVGRNWYGFSHTYLSLSSAPLHRSLLLSTSSPCFPLQLQNQLTRVEQFQTEAQLLRVSFKSRVVTELRGSVAEFLIDSQ